MTHNNAETKRCRVVVMGLCFLLGLVNYLDRVIISFAIEPIKNDRCRRRRPSSACRWPSASR